MSKLERLLLVEHEVETCASCNLCLTPGKHVMCRGSADAKVAFIGEAPGFHEAEQGIPFVGRSGKLLDKMIEAMGINRDDVFVANICKHRPPNNRKPTRDEMDACLPFLEKQLDIVGPKAIVTLGATATEGFLGPGPGITKRRGKWGTYKDIAVMPTFHPAACLYNPSLKDDVRKDLQEVSRFMGISLHINSLPPFLM